MTFRIRKLEAGCEHAGYCRNCGPLATPHGLGIFDVHAAELTLTSSEIDERLARGELHSTDLVRVGECWMSLADSPYFADAAAPLATREARVRWLKAASFFVWVALWYAVLPRALSFLLRAF
jgi:hypothetical protein